MERMPQEQNSANGPIEEMTTEARDGIV
jgi:hypothetical protein